MESTLERFRGVIAARLGLQCDDTKLAVLPDVLQRRAEAGSQSVDHYLAGLEQWADIAEIGALAAELTVPETYFFRHFDQYRALTDGVLPELLDAKAGVRRLHMASLGCASGEEAYTLAMLARDAVDHRAWDVSIVGVDVNPVVLDRAHRGRYSEWALRETPEDARRRWFRNDGREFVVSAEARSTVRFEQRNLVEDDPRLWPRDAYDVVFCRNVIMYFSPEQAQALIHRIWQALGPGGYLFLGHAETLRGLSADFHLRHTHGTFYYQKRERSRDRPGPAVRANAASAARPASPPSRMHHADWVDAIHRASERLIALTQSKASRPPAASCDAGAILELMRADRVAEAMAGVDAMSSAAANDPDVRLLRAVLQTHTGLLSQAEAACRRVLEVDDLSAGAHYLLALCREGSGDRTGAVYHHQVAAYLDPGFAMPRLHLGLLARRAGEHDAASRELAQALVLLQREDAARVLMFGGGFSRDALIALCRSELRLSGGRP